MRTTIQLDDHLHDLARHYALSNGTTFTKLIEEALREKLLVRPKHKKKTPITLPTVGGFGLQPGVDLDDNVSLLDIMDAD